jgi:hypothetical protein
MAIPKTWLFDGFFSLEGGMDAGRPPSTLTEIQVARAINATFRGGYSKPRIGVKRLPLTFDNAGDEPLFTSARYQGAGSYISPNGSASIVMSLGGQLFQVPISISGSATTKPNITSITPKAVGGINLPNASYTYQIEAWDAQGHHQHGATKQYNQLDSPNTTPELKWSVMPGATTYRIYRTNTGTFGPNSLVTIINAPTLSFVDQVQTLQPGTPQLNDDWPNTHTVTNLTSISGISPVNSPVLPKAWFCQAEEFLIIQDNQSRPLIYDGATTRRAADDEVPTGGPMAYGIGRLWVARGREYFGGDLVWSDPSLGTASLLKFTENDFLNEGGAFMVPWQTGRITALNFTAQPDTVTGEGSLMVFTRSGIFEFAAPVDRTIWKDMEQPLQRFSLLNFGATSHESVSQVNGDLFFRAEDGIRSFFFARRDFNTWGNTPQSREVEPVMDRDDQALLFWASAITFDNRFMATAEPVWTDTGVEHRRLVALDFDLISGIRAKVPPAWDGEWVPSERILQLVTVQQDIGRRAFVIARDEVGKLGIWEFLSKETGDDSEPPEWSLETKSFQFGAPLDRKRLTTVELWIDDVEGAYNINAFWRSDNKGCWVPWARFTGFGSGCLTTPATNGNGSCPPPRMPVAQSRNRIGLPIAPDRMDQLNCEPFRDGYEFQLRLECTGHFVIKKARLVAELLSQEVYGRISDDCEALPEDCQTCQ